MVFAGMLVALAGAVVWSSFKPRRWRSISSSRRGAHLATVEARVAQYGARVAARLRPLFEARGLTYPPGAVAFVAFKDARVLELYARDSAQHAWTPVLHERLRAALAQYQRQT
jgi:hypothetical protein